MSRRFRHPAEIVGIIDAGPTGDGGFRVLLSCRSGRGMWRIPHIQTIARLAGREHCTTPRARAWCCRWAPSPHLTVIGHSYGAVVTAIAAPWLRADDLVLLGSPGTRAQAVGDLGHGIDPTDPAFRARPVPVGGTAGHSGYFRPLSGLVGAVAGLLLR